MSARAAVVHARQDYGWNEFARLVAQARKSAGDEEGLTGHGLTKWGLRRLQLDLEDLLSAVTVAADAATVIPGNPDATVEAAREQRATEDHRDEALGQ